MRGKRRSLGEAVAFAFCLTACHTGGSSGPQDSAPSSAPSAPSAPPLPSASASAPPRTTMQMCRAATILGNAKLTSLSGAPLAIATLSPSSDIPDDVWIDLEAGAKLTSTHPRTTRETTFLGPARVRSCVGHAEESWVESGKFESVLSSGERPGGEEWIVTPVGVIRYGAAKVELFVGAEAAGGVKAEVKVSSGTAFAWTGDEAGAVKPPVVPPRITDAAATVADGWIRLDGPRTVTLTQKKAPKAQSASELAQAGIDRCKAEAKTAKDLAVAVATPDASLARLAPKQVIARHIARAACNVALLRVGALDPSPARESFYAVLKEAETDWRGRVRGPHGRFH